MNIDLVVQVGEIARPGETIIGQHLQKLPGGKGSNQAAAAAMLGTDVTLVAVVGDDDFGTFLIESAENNGVDVSLVQRHPQEPTGTAFISVSDSGENSIVVVPGANACLTSKIAETTLQSLGQFEVMSTCLEIPTQTILTSFRIAQMRGAKTVLNASPYTTDCLPLFELTDYLIVNEHEISQIVQVEIDDETRLRNSLFNLGIRHAIITLGSRGAMYLNCEDSSQAVLKFPTPLIQVLDTTGCGDAFAGAFASEIADGRSIKDALTLAVRAGSFAATRFGAQSSYGTKSEILEL